MQMLDLLHDEKLWLKHQTELSNLFIFKMLLLLLNDYKCECMTFIFIKLCFLFAPSDGVFLVEAFQPGPCSSD